MSDDETIEEEELDEEELDEDGLDEDDLDEDGLDEDGEFGEDDEDDDEDDVATPARPSGDDDDDEDDDDVEADRDAILKDRIAAGDDEDEDADDEQAPAKKPTSVVDGPRSMNSQTKKIWNLRVTRARCRQTMCLFEVCRSRFGPPRIPSTVFSPKLSTFRNSPKSPLRRTPPSFVTT